MTAVADRNKALLAARGEIDALDRAILELVERRFAQSVRIAGYKAPVSRYCPGRESSVMGRILKNSDQAPLLLPVWRALMNSSLAVQGGLEVAVAGGDLSLLQTLAGQWFGQQARYHLHDDADGLPGRCDCLVTTTAAAVTSFADWPVRMVLPFDPRQSRQIPQALVLIPAEDDDDSTQEMQPLWLCDNRLSTTVGRGRQIGLVPRWCCI